MATPANDPTPPPATKQELEKQIEKKAVKAFNDDTAPMCYNCGNQTQKAGSCYVCTACGSTTGCS